MTNDSLIDYAAFKIALERNKGQTYSDSKEAFWRFLEMYLSQAKKRQTSEIPDAELSKIADYIWNKIQRGEPGISRAMIAREIKEALGTYLATREPVKSYAGAADSSSEGKKVKSENMVNDHTPAPNKQPVGTSPLFFNSHCEERLTKAGGMTFDVWAYILVLENKAHGNPTGDTEKTDWRDYYDNNYTPHAAIEEDFDNGN